MERVQQPWRLTPDQVLEALDPPTRNGIEPGRSPTPLAEHGPNELIERGLRSPWRILVAQFTEVMVVVLIVAAASSFLVGDLKDTIAILGFTQEYRAERAMAAPLRPGT